jgi:hypothetical protein
VSRRAAVLAWAAALALASCGDDEPTAEELVAELNDHGAGLELGVPLRSEREGYEIRALGVGDVSGGSITITPGTDAGAAEFERCRSAGLLVCFRAGNAVLIFEDELTARDRARIESALERAASD